MQHLYTQSGAIDRVPPLEDSMHPRGCPWCPCVPKGFHVPPRDPHASQGMSMDEFRAGPARARTALAPWAPGGLLGSEEPGPLEQRGDHLPWLHIGRDGPPIARGHAADA